MTAPEFAGVFGDDQRAYHQHTWPSVHNKGSEQDTFIKARIPAIWTEHQFLNTQESTQY